MQAPEPRAPEVKALCWAPPLFVSGPLLPAAGGVEGGPPLTAPPSGPRAPWLCLALLKDSRLKRNSWGEHTERGRDVMGFEWSGVFYLFVGA